MRLLLDTHILLWWLRDRLQLREEARALIASPKVEVLVSTASFWEIAIKFRLGKLEMSSSDAFQLASGEGFGNLSIKAEHIAQVELLPKIAGHRDPFDHLLLAQAKVEEAALMTSDRILARYGIRCVPA